MIYNIYDIYNQDTMTISTPGPISGAKGPEMCLSWAGSNHWDHWGGPELVGGFNP